MNNNTANVHWAVFYHANSAMHLNMKPWNRNAEPAECLLHFLEEKLGEFSVPHLLYPYQYMGHGPLMYTSSSSELQLHCKISLHFSSHIHGTNLLLGKNVRIRHREWAVWVVKDFCLWLISVSLLFS